MHGGLSASVNLSNTLSLGAVSLLHAKKVSDDSYIQKWGYKLVDKMKVKGGPIRRGGLSR